VRLSPDARVALIAAAWPGNVRELENVISRAVLRASVGARDREALLVERGHLDLDAGSNGVVHEDSPGRASAHAGSVPSIGMPLRDQLDEFQRRAIEDAVRRHAGNWAAAARELGMHRSNLHRLAARLGVRG
jgi:anaerobic nitric oxide reductase transcription regulator